MIRTMIADGEAKFSDCLCELLDDEGDFEVAGTFSTISSLIDAAKTSPPDLIFVDLEISVSDAEEVEMSRYVSAHDTPVVFVARCSSRVFRTMHPNVIDCLPKSLDRSHLRRGLARVRHRLRCDPSSASPRRSLLAVKNGGRLRIVDLQSLDWVEAAANYIRLHRGGVSYLVREAIGSFEKRLDSRHFVRIHRSTIVNIARLAQLDTSGRHYKAVLNDGTTLRVGAAFRENLHRLIIGLSG